MTVERNGAIAMVKLYSWLKVSRPPDFQPMRSKIMATAPCTCDFSRALVIAVVFRESDWFIALFAPAVIGRSL